MTTPNQRPPDGAYVIDQGGGEYNYGQGITDKSAASLMVGHFPSISLQNPLAAVGSAIGVVADTLFSLPLEVLQLFENLIPGDLGDAFETVAGAVGAIIDRLSSIGPMFGSVVFNAVNDGINLIKTIVNQIMDIIGGFVVTPINQAVQGVKDWWTQIGQTIANAADTVNDALTGIWNGLTGHTTGTTKSIADVTNAAAYTSGQAESGVQIGELNSAVLGIRNNKSIMSGIDETEESTFLLSDLFNGAADPPSIACTASSVPIGFWRATETAKKGFVSWFGKGFASITALYVDIYRLNYVTSTMDLVHTSPNQISQVTSSWGYLVYNIALESDRIMVNAGDVIGMAIRVVGTGTHTIAGKSAPWMPDHPTVIPSRPSAVRTGSGDLAFGSITYSGNVPWFGIGIITGDVPNPIFIPRTTTFTTPGSWSYSIPEGADIIDHITVGGGGGAAGGDPFFGTHGVGGKASAWVGESLVRGVDFPIDATTLTGVIGAGGARGVYDNNGSPGGTSRRNAITGGKAAFSTPGGLAGVGKNTSLSHGGSTGSFTWNGVTYVGGSGGGSYAAQNGVYGSSPGAGGGGGGGGTYGVAWDGGGGAPGIAILVARKA